MKKFWWIAASIIALCLGTEMYHRWRMLNPASASSFEPARENQASPSDTINTMFEAILLDPNVDIKDQLFDKLDDAHLVTGKDMTPEEEKFAQLFLDHQRSAVIYHYLRSQLTKTQRITGTVENKSSATVNLMISVLPDHQNDWTEMQCTIEMKKKGPNWYVDELRSPQAPNGVYAPFRKRLDAMPSIP